MNRRQLKLEIESLLHDIGKIVYRSGDGRNHSQSGFEYLRQDAGISDREILDCVRFHHGARLKTADLEQDSLAYLTYFADNVAAAADHREGENPEYGFDKKVPLSSIFNILNGNHENLHYERRVLNPKGKINAPVDRDTPLDESFYRRIIANITDNLKGIDLTEDYLNSLLSILEANTTYLPSSTSQKELTDISLFDHLKMTAAIAQCVERVLEEKDIRDYKDRLFRHAQESYEEQWFLLYSMDISSIQKFIYSIVPENALKGLRARSFYLEVTMEHIVDELLTRLSLSRVNLIYTGGGHCYLLLPNTEAVRAAAKDWKREVNRWLMERFDTGLYIAGAGVPCSARDLQNDPAGSYRALFHNLFEQLSAEKAHRYSAEDILYLNSRKEKGERECRVCRRMEPIFRDGKCRICASLESSSANILYTDYFAISRESNGSDLPLPGGCYLQAMEEDELKAFMKKDAYVRCYTKNEMCTGLHVTTKLLVGNYTCGMPFDQMAKTAEGIDRIAVLRADVDNLGHAFVQGIPDPYLSLSRTATFSRQMSLFFKGYLNGILENGESCYFSSGGKRNVTIVYSGGDDLFLVGAWNEVIDAFVDIRNAFARFTQETLTLSGGVGLYPGHYPVNVMALETAELEQAAKDVPEKNAAVLFTAEAAFPWKILIGQVFEEKYRTLSTFFDQSEEHGKAFLYRLLELLRDNEEKIQFARYIYLLSRMEPGSDQGEEKLRNYRAFSKKMCEWYQNSEDRKQLITAIYLYVYRNREELPV